MANPHDLCNASKDAIRWLARQHCGTYLARDQVILEAKLSELEYEGLLSFLAQRQAVEIVPSDDGMIASSFSVKIPIRDIVAELDNPPPRDRHKEITSWFFNKWWSIPLWILFTGLVVFIKNQKAILEWMGFKK